MDDEMSTLYKNSTLELTIFSLGKQLVGCRWVYVVEKYHSEGTMERLKTRLVAKGYTQTFGVNYFEPFSPEAPLNSIQILLSIVVASLSTLHQKCISSC